MQKQVSLLSVPPLIYTVNLDVGLISAAHLGPVFLSLRITRGLISRTTAGNRAEFRRHQSRTQSPQALWPAVCRQGRLWGTGILLPQNFCGKTIQTVAGQPFKKIKFFRVPQSLYLRLPADQKARGLWVRDCDVTSLLAYNILTTLRYV